MSDRDHQLNRWNWGAFLLTPIWAFANKLDIWGILWFIPLVNVGIMIYLGIKGNRLAYKKNGIESVDDFMKIQKGWSKWGLRIFLIILVLSIGNHLMHL